MSKADNLKDFLVDLANAIREKKNKTGAINPQDFSAEILSIIAGDVQMPNVSGTLVVTEGITEEDYETLKLVLGNNITIDAQGGIYIHFADPEVLRVLLANITPNDGVGITKAQVEAVTSIGTWFKDNTEIETFDEFEKFTGITTLHAHTFLRCSNLKKVIMPNSIISVNDATWTDIHAGAFEKCASLESVILSNNLKTIGSQAFKGDTSLLSIVIPNSVEAIHLEAFRDCTSLVIANLNNDKISYIGARAFRNTKITGAVNLPSLTSIGIGAFRATEIVNIISLGTITAMSVSSNDYEGGVFQNCYLLTTVNLPNTLKEIDRWCFQGCSALSTVSLPNTLEIIKSNAFYSCTSLDYIELPSSIIRIEDGAFYLVPCEFVVNLPNLESFPHGLYAYGAFAYSGIKRIVNLGNILELQKGSNNKFGVFCHCENLNDVILPESLTSIGSYAFYGCTSLSAILIRAATPPTLELNAFQETNNCPIYVPDASVEAYKTATNWSSYASRIKGVSELQTDNPTLYEEVKEYL